MTIEQLLDCDAATLEKMSNKELKAHFDKYFIITRPEMQTKRAPSSNSSPTKANINPAILKASEALKAAGIQIDINPMLWASKKKKK